MPLFRSGKPHWRLGLSADQVKPAGLSAITWDAVLDEEPDFFGPGSSDIVQPSRAGLYVLCAQVVRASLTAPAQLQLSLTRNGVELGSSVLPSSANTIGITVSTIAQLDVGDQLRVLYQGSTVLPSIIRSSSTFFGGARIGPVRWTG